MRSQFDSPIETNPQTGEVEACGPLKWEGEEDEAAITVTVTQRNGKATASGSQNFKKSDGKSKWMIHLMPTDKRFASSSVFATGVICAMGGNADANVFTWSEEVKIKVEK